MLDAKTRRIHIISSNVVNFYDEKEPTTIKLNFPFCKKELTSIGKGRFFGSDGNQDDYVVGSYRNAGGIHIVALV